MTIPLPFAPLVVTPQALVAITAIVGLSLIHISGLGPGRLVHNVLATMKVLALVAFVALGLSIGIGSFWNLERAVIRCRIRAPAGCWR